MKLTLMPPVITRSWTGWPDRCKVQLGKRHLTQFVSLGQGDLTEAEARLIATATNFDAVGINCYREDPNAFEDVISLAAKDLKVPIYFAEVGWPADDRASEAKQSDYLWHVCSIAFSHAAGRVSSGNVLGVFVCEATDEAWKKFERGKASDAHYGILGKAGGNGPAAAIPAQSRISARWWCPTTTRPTRSSRQRGQCLYGHYTLRYPRDYGYAMAYRKSRHHAVSGRSPQRTAGNWRVSNRRRKSRPVPNSGR